MAGKRAGLKHSANGDDETTRSGLFMEAVRIIKEMRKATNGKYPKYAIWENVMGAFSSNAGEDFRVVLEELIKICEPQAPPIPSPGKTGWPYADCIVGDGWSLAYRVLDAQHWGVAQRRRRVYALLDLTGGRAEKILFEREGLRGYFTESGTPWQGIAGNPQDGSTADDPQSGIIAIATQQGGAEISKDGICPTVTAAAGMSGNNQPWICCENAAHHEKRCENAAAYGISSYDSNAMKSSNPHSGIYEATTSRTLDLNGGNPACNQGGIAIVEEQSKMPTYGITCKGNGDGFVSEERHTALSAGGGQPGQGYPCVMQPIAFTQNQRDELRDLGDKAGALQAEPGMKQQTFIIDNIGGQAEYGVESCVSSTLRSGALGAICYDARGNGDGNTVNTITGDHNNRITDYSSVVVYNGENITSPTNKANPQPGDPCHTLGTDSRNHLVYCLQGNGIDRADTAGCNGKGWKEDVCYTLNTIDRPAVSYGFMRQLGGVEAQEEISPTVLAAAGESGNNKPCVSYATDVGFFNTCEDVSPTMLARMYKDPHLISYEEPEYIVRRLTPTECARLQGFPDRWGDIPHKETFTDGEYSFWLEVRNTHAAINGRATKDYTKEQILKWYNKLHSDSSEYKMWGNGIALPNALYVMQGIAEAEAHG